MPVFEVDFEVYCGRCGDGICHSVTVDNRHMKLTITPCEKCLDERYNNGYEVGHEAGHEKGHEEGYELGHNNGYGAGHEEGSKENCMKE